MEFFLQEGAKMVSLKPWPIPAVTFLLSTFLVLLLALPAMPSMAMDEALLGRWARAGGSCEEDMTIKIARDGLSGSEYFCAPKGIKRDKGGWKINFSCSAEGEAYTLRAHWRLLKNGQLREVIDGKTAHYDRCSALDEVLLDPANPYTAPSRCVSCFNEAQSLGRSVGGYCPAACGPAFEAMVCDSSGICRLPD
jgi:hypothetical protein